MSTLKILVAAAVRWFAPALPESSTLSKLLAQYSLLSGFELEGKKGHVVTQQL